MLYQVMAQNWITTNIRASTFFFHQKAEQRVRTNATIMTMVATILVLANMLDSCFIGPIKNTVLAAMEIMMDTGTLNIYLPREVRLPIV